MKFKLFLFALGFSFFGMYAQIDSPKKKLNFAPIPDKNAPIQNSSEEKVPTVIKFESSIGKDKDNAFKSVSLSPKVELKTTQKEPVRNAGELYTDKVKSSLKQESGIAVKFKSDSFLGSFESETKIIKIACRDHEYPDGDIVRIWLNDLVAINAITLTEDFSSVYLDLQEGINKIEIEALNQGESGPNTAQFVITNENGVTVTNNKWNLLTGAKAKLVITKVDEILRK